MRFINAITVPRSGRDADAFCLTWDNDVAVAKLSASRPHTFAEYLRCPGGHHHNAAPGKLYLDRDVYVGADPPTPELIEQHTLAVRSRVMALTAALGTETNDLWSVVATRHGWCPAHGQHKLSYRPFVQGMTIRYTDIPHVIRFMHQEDFWDMSVYKPSEQLLAAINGHKGRIGNFLDERVLQPEDGYDDPLMYVVQHVEPDWILLDLPEDFHAQQLKRADARPRANPVCDVDPVFVCDLVACLSVATSDDRDRWIRIAIVLKSLGCEHFFDAWVAFSRRSRKFNGEDDCRKTWDSLRSVDSVSVSGGVSIGSLCFFARGDDPAAFKVACRSSAARKAIPMFVDDDNVDDGNEIVATTTVDTGRVITPRLRLSIIRQLVVRWPEHFNGRLSDDTTVAFDVPDNLCFSDGPISGRINRKFFVYITVPPSSEKFIGLLCSDVPIDGPLHALHRSIQPELQFVYNQTSEDRATLTSTVPGTICTLLYGDTKDAVISVNVRGNKELTINNRSKIDDVHVKMASSTHKHVTSSLGFSAGTLFIGIGVNNGTINVYNGAGPEAGRKTDEELTTILMDGSPDVIARMKFSPDAKSSNCNGIYYCDPTTHVWTQESNAFHEQVLLQCFLPVLNCMSHADRRHVESKRGRGDILYAVASRRIHRRFDELLDSNLDVFVLDNGLFDMRTMTFRPLEQNDYVLMTAGWSYDVSIAIDTRPALDAFLCQVFPVDIERRVVLSYIAHLLSGRRTVKKFLVLTDRRAGNNGKSTFAKLLQLFFGTLSKSSTKFVCKGSFDQDRNAHDGGLQNFKGKRLLIAEELKHTMMLDEAMLKSYSGGEGTLVEGRKMGSADEFRFVWQAGFMLIFNQGDCPKFDAADQAFMDRIIVAPMRSKFVRTVRDDDGEFTFNMNVDIVAQLPNWRSALADVLMEHMDKDILMTLPPSMSEWRQGVVDGANPLSEWIDERVDVTGVRTDHIVMGELKRAFTASGSRAVAPKEFPGLARAYLLGQPGVTYKEDDRVGSAAKRGVMRCVRLKLALPLE